MSQMTPYAQGFNYDKKDNQGIPLLLDLAFALKPIHELTL